MPFISIIVPVYNSENTLQRCVESLLRQNYNDYEIILVNDGSTDSSETICKDYAAKYQVIKLINTSNQGPGSARNKAMQHANGEWMVFVDSDDYVNTCYLDSYVDCLTEYPNADMLVQGFTIRSISGTETLVSFAKSISEIETGMNALYDRPMPGALWNKAFNREYIINNNIIFDPLVRFKEDEDFILSYCRNISKIAFQSSVGYTYALPNWKGKYKYDNYYVCKKLYEKMNAFSFASKGSFYCSIVNGFVDSVINSFYIGSIDKTRMHDVYLLPTDSRYFIRNKWLKKLLYIPEPITYFFLKIYTNVSK